jgi:hypothetical protein
MLTEKRPSKTSKGRLLAVLGRRVAGVAVFCSTPAVCTGGGETTSAKGMS